MWQTRGAFDIPAKAAMMEQKTDKWHFWHSQNLCQKWPKVPLLVVGQRHATFATKCNVSSDFTLRLSRASGWN
jgi:hypothetical protein